MEILSSLCMLLFVAATAREPVADGLPVGMRIGFDKLRFEFKCNITRDVHNHHHYHFPNVTDANVLPGDGPPLLFSTALPSVKAVPHTSIPDFYRRPLYSSETDFYPHRSAPAATIPPLPSEYGHRRTRFGDEPEYYNSHIRAPSMY